MFNQLAFNLVPFNREFTVDVYGNFDFEASGDLMVTANMIVSPSFDFDAGGDLLFHAIRERFGAFILDSLAELELTGVRDLPGHFDFEATGALSFSAGRNHVDIIEFTGEFKPGDRIIIDSNALRFTQNGLNALHLMSGDFFDLNLGTNELVYTDGQGSRTVLIRITYRDKYV